MTTLVSRIVAVLALAVIVPLRAEAQLEPLVLFDNFNAANQRINPSRFFGSESSSNPGSTEAERGIVNGALRLFYRSHGNQTSNSGTTFTALNLNFTNLQLVTAIRARVMVTQASASGCSIDPQSLVSVVSARLQGTFFNATVPTAGSSVDDVFANVRVARVSSDAPGLLRVQGRAWRCTDATCNNSQCIHMGCGTDSESRLDLGNVVLGQTVRILVQWDPDSDRFVFQRGNQPQQFIDYSGVLSDASPPSFTTKQLRIGAAVANCTALPRPRATMEALFDDVFVNQSASP